jgi:hypothetical protein
MTQVRLRPAFKGRDFVRLATVMALADGNTKRASILAEQRYGEASLAHQVTKAGGREMLVEKDAVPAGATASGNWARLLGDYESAAAEFFSYVNELSLPGRIPGHRRVPLLTRLVGAASGFSAAWVGEGMAKPVGRATYAEETLPPFKVSSLTVLTMELLESMDPMAELTVRNMMAGSVVSVINASFADPANAGTSDIEPAGIAYGAPVDAVTGTSDDDDIRQAISFSIGQFDGDLTRAVILGRPEFFAHIGLNSAFQTEPLGARGGSLGGIPAIATNAVPLDAGGKQQLILLDPDAIAYGEEGFDVRTSRKASIEMLDNPTNSSITPTATNMVSLWSTNSMGILCEARLNWQLARAGGVRVINGLVGGVAS